MSFLYYTPEGFQEEEAMRHFLGQQYGGACLTHDLHDVVESPFSTNFLDMGNALSKETIRTQLVQELPLKQETMSLHYIVGAQEQFIDEHLRELMQHGFFGAYHNPLSITKLEDILSWSHLSFPSATGTVYAICGTKSVGKSEVINHILRHVPETTMIPKYSSRKQRTDDLVFSDTFALQGSSLEQNYRDHVHWESYGNRCVISRRDIDQALEQGTDVFLAIGQVEGLESVLSYYPELTDYFIITREKEQIESALSHREQLKQTEQNIDPSSILSVQDDFMSSFRFATIENYSFFNVARTTETYLSRKRYSNVFS